jgi:class 3 adenylate cyclase
VAEESSLSKEQEILRDCEALLADQPETVKVADYRQLTAEYGRLHKNLQRLIRISDKNEARLHSVSDELESEKHKLEGLAEQLSRYLPKQIYESIFNSDRVTEIKTQRKLLTVFFSDIQGFTHISSVVQPEVLTHYINAYFSEMSEIASRHGGTIDKFIGDAMMVFFGDPETRGSQQDALSCVRMAYEMQQRLSQLHIQWEAEGLQHPFITRIGINTGYCNVGNFGSHTRMAYTILGGEVNLAARIESQSEPGGILISHETYSLVKDYVEVVEREPLHLKGIPLPVRTYAVTKVHATDRSLWHELLVQIPNRNGQLSIRPADLSMPERLSLIARLRDIANTLEGSEIHD